MKFGPVPVSEAEGAIAAHSLRLKTGVIKKGTRLTSELVARLVEEGVREVVAARLDPADVHEDEAARRIAAVGIDILVNLNGYFGTPRNGVFARRPAPVQVSYMGFPATMGAPWMDYVLADRTVIPQEERRF
jgi:predicted O-linked N-acetylglucosamine transferase (SPINDLY family)